MLIRYLHGEGHTVDIGEQRYVWNYKGNGDTIEMPDDVAQELLDSLSGHDYEEVTEEAAQQPPTTTRANNPISFAPGPLAFGPAPTSAFVTNPNPASAPEVKEG